MKFRERFSLKFKRDIQIKIHLSINLALKPRVGKKEDEAPIEGSD